MKKKIFLCAICIAMMGVYVNAQKNSNQTPPPPPPPAPPVVAMAPPPPTPPPPPEPVQFTPPTIVKDGIDFKINSYNGKTMITVYKNNEKVDKVDMKDWEAKKAFYEKKYGSLPTPPPPPPAPPTVI
jgi:hypothetical protein